MESKMNIRTAILSAADSIEQNPNLFDFRSCEIPNHNCGKPGCALGWIARYLGSEYVEPSGVAWISDSFTDDALFYRNMNLICGSEAWKNSAAECSKSLRLYADKYHPAKNEQAGIPDSVLAIFEEGFMCKVQAE